MSGEKGYSESTAFAIDKEITQLISKALKKAQDVIIKKMDTLVKIAKELIEKETLEQKEYYALVK
jgi:cell division protease FtsH